MEKYYLYILESETSGKYYVGISSNVRRRLNFHNSIEKGFTSRYRPWKLIYEREFPDKSSAMQVEKKVKSWKSRKMIERLISGEINF